MTRDAPRVLLLIPSVAKTGIAAEICGDRHPNMDYLALQAELQADLADYSTVERSGIPAITRLARRAGRDFALAAYGYAVRRRYDVIFCNGENVGIPLALFLKGRRSRPGHVLIGHRLTPRKKRPFLRALHPQMDALILYSSGQCAYAREELGVPEAKLNRIPFHADHRFFRPLPPAADAPPRLVCSAGLEWRDYPTLLEAVTGLDVELRIAAASPWSRHRDETAGRALPPNVSARRYDYHALRGLYADSRIVVTPLYENDFQAGVTTLLEGMAMGRACIVTRTTGQSDVVRNHENGLYVPPGDPAALRKTLLELLDSPEQTSRLGAQARRDIEEEMTLDHWVARVACLIRSQATTGSQKA